MENHRVTSILKLILIYFLCKNAAGEEVLTWITPSAILQPIDHVTIYEEVGNLVFPISDIPEPPVFPTFTKYSTTFKWFEKWYIMASSTSELNFQRFKILVTHLKQFTYRGLDSSKYEPEITNKPTGFTFENINETVWTKKWSRALLDRKYELKSIRNRRSIPNDYQSNFESQEVFANTSGTCNKTLIRKPRSPLTLIPISTTLFGAKGLVSMFIKNDLVLPSLIKMVKELPKTLKVFMNVPNVMSEFTTGRKGLAGIVKDLANKFKRVNDEQINMEKITEEKDIPDAMETLNTFFNWNAVLHQQSAVLSSLITESTIQAMTVESCRNKLIPILVVPPKLLAERMQNLYQDLKKSNSDLEMCISPDDVWQLYSLPIAECCFDDDGGLVAINIHMKRSLANFKMFLFKAYAFQYYNQTCELSVPSTYVIQEMNSGSMYTVDIDEEFCRPKTSPLCRLPHAANADVSNHFCFTTLMTGGSAAEIKTACPIICREGNSITSVQENDDAIIVAHLPENGAEVICDNGQTEPIKHSLQIGAIRVRLGCGCRLTYNKKVVGRSLQKICRGSFSANFIEQIIPVPLTILDEWVPDINNNFKGMKVKAYKDLLDEEFQTTNTENMPKLGLTFSTYLFLFPGITLFNAILMWICLFFIFCKNRNQQWVYVAAANDSSATTSAAKTVQCESNSEETILEYIILGIIVTYILPKLGHMIYTRGKKNFDDIVDSAAEKRLEV